MNAPIAKETVLVAALGSVWSDVARRLGLEEVLTRFALAAPKRDVERILLTEEVAELKRLKFGAARLPVEAGGLGITLPELFQLGRDAATADSNLAHSLRNHFGSVERHLRTPDAPFSRKVLDLVAAGAILGGAYSEDNSAPAGSLEAKGTTLSHDPSGGYRLNGSKLYSTGNIYSDYLFVAATWADTGLPVQVLIPKDREGVAVEDDWEGFGQKLTGSGRTGLVNVHVGEEEVAPPDTEASRYAGYYSFTFPQLFLTTVISGIAQRIFADGLQLVATRGRNFYHAQFPRVADEPSIQSVIGQLAAHSHAIVANVDRAIAALDLAWARRDEADGKALSLAAAITAAEAKLVTEETATRLASSLIDLASGSSVSFSRALDRHWRNIKVISSHNPRIYKERVLGDFYLNGTTPPTGPYF